MRKLVVTAKDGRAVVIEHEDKGLVQVDIAPGKKHPAYMSEFKIGDDVHLSATLVPKKKKWNRKEYLETHKGADQNTLKVLCDEYGLRFETMQLVA